MKNFYAYLLFMVLGIIIGVAESSRLLVATEEYILGATAICMISGCFIGLYFVETPNKQSIIKTLISVVSTILLLVAAFRIWIGYLTWLYRSKLLEDVNIILKVGAIFVPLIIECIVASIISFVIHNYLKLHTVNLFKNKK